MSIIEEIEDAQNMIRKKLTKDLNFSSPEQLDTFIEDFRKSDKFKQYESQSWHSVFYNEFKASLSSVQPCDFHTEAYDTSIVLRNIYHD